ncbi:glycosyltransferase, partial [Aquipuribacter hungaricus]
TEAEARRDGHVAAAAYGLRQRLRAGLDALQVPVEDVPGALDRPDGIGESAGVLLDAFCRRVAETGAEDEVWLLLTLVLGEFPDEATVLATRRRVVTGTPAETAVFLLSTATATRGARPDLGTNAVVLQDTVLVDVDFCATSEHHTGIQRVVRETVPLWAVHHPLVLTGWWSDRPAYRPLLPHEVSRVVEWGGRPSSYREPVDAAQPDAMLVPWRCHVVLPETPSPDRSPALAALGRCSGNRLSLVGYDCIPLVSPELVHPGMPDRFMEYLTVVKHSHAVAGISASATEEFAAFADMLGAQGLDGPVVSEVSLPEARPAGQATTGEATSLGREHPDGPLVVCIGSFEPRKNQVSVLLAAERLWREGLRFRLRFIGGGGYRTEFDDLLARLRAAGRSVDVLVQASDEDLLASYEQARFTVFVSFHEGYGLPVTESLAHGTPVLTTSYGSTAEIAALGGCLVADPRDHEDVRAQMHRLLTDDALVARLQDESAARPPTSWDRYAEDTWRVLVEEVQP